MQLLDGLVHAGDVLEADLRRVGVIRLARDFPKDITFEPPPCTWFIRKIQKAIRITNGRSEVRSDHQGDPPTAFESKLTPSVFSPLEPDERFRARIGDLDLLPLVVAARRLVLDRQLLLVRVGDDLLELAGVRRDLRTGARSR